MVDLHPTPYSNASRNRSTNKSLKRSSSISNSEENNNSNMRKKESLIKQQKLYEALGEDVHLPDIDLAKIRYYLDDQIDRKREWKSYQDRIQTLTKEIGIERCAFLEILQR